MTTSLRGISNLFKVDRRTSKPLYQQVYQGFRQRIAAGELRAGELVPSTRELARELGVSRLPVLNAYAQLLAEGYFESRIGAGTYIATALARAPKPFAQARSAPVSTNRAIAKNAGRLPPYQPPHHAANLGPFQVGQPDLHQFPIETWLRLVTRYSRSMRVKALQYGDPMGRTDLREVIATYLRTSRGVRCEATQVMIVSGSQQAIDLTIRVLLNPGSPVWVEEPAYWLVKLALQANGCLPVPIPVDYHGLNVAAGIKLSRRARAAFVAPSHQYPLGVTMSASRRMELIDWAERAGAWIVEDDYDSEFRYDSMPIAALQGLDYNQRVIYIGSFSKVLFPSMRMGYLVIPADLVERFAAVRQAMDICPPDLTQAVAAEFIREGHFARHIRRMRPVYAERRSALLNAAGDNFADKVEVSGEAAGMHVTLLFNQWLDDQKIAARAVQHGLWLSPLSQSYLREPKRSGFVLGFGNSSRNQIASAMRQLKLLLSAS